MLTLLGRTRPDLGRLQKFTSISFCLLFSIFATACNPSLRGGPERMFSVDEEIEFARAVSDPAMYRRYAQALGPEKKRLRNQIVHARMYGIDQLYSEYEGKLTTERQSVGFYSALAQMGLNSAGALTGGEEAKTILHLAATGLTGTKEAYEQEVLIEKTIDILQKSMRANRKKLRVKILERLSIGTDRYPLELALSDLEDYYRAGTITGALIGVSEDTSLRLNDAKLEEELALNRFLQTSHTPRIKAFYGASSENRALVLDWLRQNAGAVPFGVFLNQARYARLHPRIIADLAIP